MQTLCWKEVWCLLIVISFNPSSCVASVWKLDLYPTLLSVVWGLEVFVKFMLEADLLMPLFLVMSRGCWLYSGKTKSLFTRNRTLDLCSVLALLLLPLLAGVLFSAGNVGQYQQLQGEAESFFKPVFTCDLSRYSLHCAELCLGFVTLTCCRA